MSLGDRIGPMIKCVFALVATFVFSIIITIVWSSAFLYLVNNPFMVFSKEGTYLRNTVSIVVATSSGAFILLVLIGVFFYFCGSHFYLHFTAIFLVAVSSLAFMVFLILILFQTTEKMQNNYIKYYSDFIQKNTTDSKEKVITNWMNKYNCTTCEDELSSYFNTRCFVGFIMTSVNILVVMTPVLALVALISLMACIKPDTISQDQENVPSELIQTLIDARRCLSEGIMTGNFVGYKQI